MPFLGRSTRSRPTADGADAVAAASGEATALHAAVVALADGRQLTRDVVMTPRPCADDEAADCAEFRSSDLLPADAVGQRAVVQARSGEWYRVRVVSRLMMVAEYAA